MDARTHIGAAGRQRQRGGNEYLNHFFFFGFLFILFYSFSFRLRSLTHLDFFIKCIVYKMHYFCLTWSCAWRPPPPLTDWRWSAVAVAGQCRIRLFLVYFFQLCLHFHHSTWNEWSSLKWRINESPASANMCVYTYACVRVCDAASARLLISFNPSTSNKASRMMTTG